MIPDCDGGSDGQTESIMAKTALCIASYADALSKTQEMVKFVSYKISLGKRRQMLTAY